MRSINFPLNFFFVNLYFSSVEAGQFVLKAFSFAFILLEIYIPYAKMFV